MAEHSLFGKRHHEFLARHLREVGAEPSTIRNWAMRLDADNPDGFDAQAFTVAASPVEDIDQLEHEEDVAIERAARRNAELMA